MPLPLYDIIVGFVLISLLAYLAFKLKALSRSGALASILIGMVILVGSGSWSWLILIIIFFTAASFFTHFKYNYKRGIGAAEAKGGARSWLNAASNGGAAALFAAAEYAVGGDIFAAAFLGVVATAASDTLATEVGLLSRVKPRLITNLRLQVEPGTSGGVTPLGTFMAVVGALIIGLAAAVLGFFDGTVFKVIVVAAVGGVLGSIADSLLGALLQEKYRCVVCGKVVEQPMHHGSKGLFVSGIHRLDNNLVNLTSTFIGAFIGMAVFLLLS
ncbi:MAG: DUF92 domain-containing protein [Nitrososphaerales archaeon]